MSNPEEEIKIQKRESILEKRRIINKFYKHIDNKSFLEMKRTLDEYYLELEEGIRENKKVENENSSFHNHSIFRKSLKDKKLWKLCARLNFSYSTYYLGEKAF